MDKVTLKDYYNFVDEHDSILYRESELRATLQNIRIQDNISKDSLANIENELTALSLTIKDGLLKSFYSNFTNGSSIGIPIIEQITEESLDYYAKRTNETNNLLLKLKYNFILWNRRRNMDFFNNSIESLIKLCYEYKKLDNIRKNEHFGLKFLDTIKNLYYIAKINGKLNSEIKSKILDFLENYDYSSSSSFIIRKTLIEIILNEKQFKKNNLSVIEIVIKKQYYFIIDNHIRNQQCISILRLGEKLEQKIGNLSFNWRLKLGETFEQLADEAKNGNNPNCLSFGKEAIFQYKRLNLEEKVKTMELKLKKYSEEIPFFRYQEKIDMSDSFKKYQEFSKILAKEDVVEIYRFLIHDDNLLPKFEDIKKSSLEAKNKFFLTNLFFSKTSFHDKNGNNVISYEKEEKNYFDILHTYNIYLNHYHIYLIDYIFYYIISNRKLNANNLTEFLYHYSWIGKTIVKKIRQEEYEKSLLDLLIPAIEEYFMQMEFYLSTGYQKPFILFIDSFVLKIEGIIREICQQNNVVTSFFTKEKNQKEKDLHALIYEDVMKELFSEDDLLFFKFVLVEQVGYNLRNNVAHALMFPQEYSRYKAHLLIIMLLRLGKYSTINLKEN